MALVVIALPNRTPPSPGSGQGARLERYSPWVKLSDPNRTWTQETQGVRQRRRWVSFFVWRAVFLTDGGLPGKTFPDRVHHPELPRLPDCGILSNNARPSVPIQGSPHRIIAAILGSTIRKTRFLAGIDTGVPLCREPPRKPVHFRAQGCHPEPPQRAHPTETVFQDHDDHLSRQERLVRETRTERDLSCTRVMWTATHPPAPATSGLTRGWTQGAQAASHDATLHMTPP